MALRQQIRSLIPLLLRSSNVNTTLPSSAFCHQSRAGLAYSRRSGQLPQDKDPEDADASDEYPSPGDTKDMAPSTYAGPDAQKPAGVGAGVSARPTPNHQSQSSDAAGPQEGEASAPDFEKKLDKDPHAADVPQFEGLNVKNEGDMDKEDPRLPEAGKGGIQQEEKPPGNNPSDDGRAAGFKQGANAPGDVSASAEDSQTGPNVEHKDMDESDIDFAGDKPDPSDIPFTRQQSR